MQASTSITFTNTATVINGTKIPLIYTDANHTTLAAGDVLKAADQLFLVFPSPLHKVVIPKTPVAIDLEFKQKGIAQGAILNKVAANDSIEWSVDFNELIITTGDVLTADDVLVIWVAE